MSRSLFHWLLVLFLFGFVLGCPPPSDDDDSSDDDDMADDDDDDDDDDPCLDVTDITNNVAGDNYIASTVGETDDFQGS